MTQFPHFKSSTIFQYFFWLCSQPPYNYPVHPQVKCLCSSTQCKTVLGKDWKSPQQSLTCQSDYRAALSLSSTQRWAPGSVGWRKPHAEPWPSRGGGISVCHTPVTRPACFQAHTAQSWPCTGYRWHFPDTLWSHQNDLCGETNTWWSMAVKVNFINLFVL